MFILFTAAMFLIQPIRFHLIYKLVEDQRFQRFRVEPLSPVPNPFCPISQPTLCSDPLFLKPSSSLSSSFLTSRWFSFSSWSTGTKTCLHFFFSIIIIISFHTPLSPALVFTLTFSPPNYWLQGRDLSTGGYKIPKLLLCSRYTSY